MPAAPLPQRSTKLSFESDKFRDLERRIERTQTRKKKAISSVIDLTDKFVAARTFRSRVAKIRVRDKPKRVLLVPIDPDHSQVPNALMASNPSAKIVKAGTLDDAVDLHEENPFEIVYLVKSLGIGKECRGPCFFSMDEDLDSPFRGQRKKVSLNMEKYKRIFPGAEVMVVCGTPINECPIADLIFARTNGSDTRVFDSDRQR